MAMATPLPLDWGGTMVVVTLGKRPATSPKSSPWDDGPVPVVSPDDEVLVRGDRGPTWRAAVPAVVVAACFAFLGGTTGDEVTAVAWVTAGLLLAAAALRVLIWVRGMAARALVSSDQYLVVTRRGEAERWIPWAAVTGIRVDEGDLLPEWHRGSGRWFAVTAEPITGVRPVSAYVGDLGEFLVRRRDRACATAAIEAAARAHGVRILETY